MSIRWQFGRKTVSMSLVVTALASAWATAGLAQTVTWNGSTDMTWTQPDSTSWSGATYESGNTAVFAGAGTGTVTISGTVTPGQVNVTSGSYTFSGGLGGSTLSSGLAKSGSGTLTLSGSAANTYQGVTTVSGGTLTLSKTSGVVAVPGDLSISGTGTMVVWTSNLNGQIGDTSAVTLNSPDGFFNGTAATAGAVTTTDTIGSLTVTAGQFSTGAVSNWTVTGTGRFDGRIANSRFVGASGSQISFGTLELVGMTGSGVDFSVPKLFFLGGNNASTVTTVTVGAGGLSLDGSILQLYRGTGAGNRVLLDGNVTVTGSSASQISTADAFGSAPSTIGLSSTSGSHVRTFTVNDVTGSTAVDLTIAPVIANGSATAGGLIKAGTGTLALEAANTYTGTTTISAGRLFLAAGGSFASSPTITVESGGVLSLTSKTSGFTFGAGQTLAGSGEVALPTSGSGVSLVGTLAPGGGAVGTLAFTGAGTLAIGSATALQFGLGATGASDLVTLSTGTLAIGSGLLNFSDFAFTDLAGFGPGTYTLFSAGSITGSLGTTSGTVGGFDSTLAVSGGTNLQLVVVPEPAGAAGWGIGLVMAGALARCRRR